MSYTTLSQVLTINEEELLNLFLGHGDITIASENQNITIEEIHDRRLLRDDEDGTETHSVKIRGISDDPRITEVDGNGTIRLFSFFKDFYILNLELRLQDRFD